MNDTNNKIFTEPQTPEALQKLVNAMNPADTQRMRADLALVSKQQSGLHNSNMPALEAYYRIGFALALIWTRANLNSKPRRENRGNFATSLYPQEREAFKVNLPNTYYSVKSTLPMNERQISIHHAASDARECGYTYGWRDGSDLARESADMPTVTTQKDLEHERIAAIEAERARAEYLRVSGEQIQKYFDDCLVHGIEPRPVSFV